MAFITKIDAARQLKSYSGTTAILSGSVIIQQVLTATTLMVGTSATTGQALVFNGSSFVASAVTATGGSGGFTGWTSSTGSNSIKQNVTTDLASGTYSLVFGQNNSAFTNYSTVVAGKNNSVSGISSSILGGTGNTVLNNFSSIIGGKNITSNQDDTVFVPSFKIRNVELVPTGATSGDTLIFDGVKFSPRNPNIIEKTYSQVTALTATSGLTSGATYFLTDKNIFLEALSKSALNTVGVYKATNADYNNTTGNFIGVWTGTILIEYNNLSGSFSVGEIISGASSGFAVEALRKVAVNIIPTRLVHTISSNGTLPTVGETMTGQSSGSIATIVNVSATTILGTIALNKIVAWNNLHYKNITGSGTIKHPKYDTTNWSALSTTDASYQIEYDKITYNIASDLITGREDRRGNVVMDKEGISTLQFQWGRNAVFGNNIYSFDFTGWNAATAQTNLLVQDSGTYISDTAAFSYSVILSRSTFNAFRASDGLASDVTHSNLTAIDGNCRHIGLHNFGDVTLMDSASSLADTEIRGATIIVSASTLSFCFIDGGTPSFQKIFTNETHTNKTFSKNVESNFSKSIEIPTGTTSLTLDSSLLYGVYKLVVTGATSATSITAITNMTAVPLRLEMSGGSIVTFVNSSNLKLKGNIDKSFSSSTEDWVEFTTYNGATKEYNSSYFLSATTSSSSSAGFTGLTSSTGANSIIQTNVGSTATTNTSIALGSGNTSSGLRASVLGGLLNSATTTNAGVVAGTLNQAKGVGSFVGAGSANSAITQFSSVMGGQNNIAGSSTGTDRYATVGGGRTNVANKKGSFIGGGGQNLITGGTYGAIAGGQNNVVGGDHSFVGGGKLNIGGLATVIGGGRYNNIYSYSIGSAILGGQSNNISFGDYSVIVGGKSNTLSGDSGFIGGGTGNTASGNYSVLVGGTGNLASGNASSILGGTGNTASGAFSIANGKNNTSSGFYSTVMNGSGNTSSGNGAFIGGGAQNRSTGVVSVITGGYQNFAAGTVSFVGAGYRNSATTQDASVVGGAYNLASGFLSFVGGGVSNRAITSGTSIVGGNANLASAIDAFIGGGKLNLSSGNRTTVGGGLGNSAVTNYSTIAGGHLNKSTGNYTFIGGGKNNIVNSSYGAAIVGGKNNLALGISSFVGGGNQNSATTTYATIVGGNQNLASGVLSFIGCGNNNIAIGRAMVNGGYKNLASGDFNIVHHGTYNTATTAYGFYFGSVINGTNNLASGAFSTVLNGTGNTAFGDFSVILNGSANTVTGLFSSILNGHNNTVSGISSTILVGSGSTINDDVASSSIIAGSNIIAVSSDTAYTAIIHIRDFMQLSATTTQPPRQIGIVWFSGGSKNRLMYYSGNNAADVVTI